MCSKKYLRNGECDRHFCSTKLKTKCLTVWCYNCNIYRKSYLEMILLLGKTLMPLHCSDITRKYTLTKFFWEPVTISEVDL